MDVDERKILLFLRGILWMRGYLEHLVSKGALEGPIL